MKLAQLHYEGLFNSRYKKEQAATYHLSLILLRAKHVQAFYGNINFNLNCHL
jgi:hypothetical protein